MSFLASYIFKPKHGHEVATKIIQGFCDGFLLYESDGFYLNWRTPKSSARAYESSNHRHLPEGYIEFEIETDGSHIDSWSEACYDDRSLTAQDMTENFFVLLGDDFWDCDEDGKKLHNFHERELSELVCALSTEDSRTVSFGGGRTAWIGERKNGKNKYKSVDLLDYALTVPIVKESATQDNQLALAL